MLAASLFASLSVLGATSAAVINTRIAPHRCDFRTYGVEGCDLQNQGVYTLEQSDAGTCKQFAAPIGSMTNVDISGGCTRMSDMDRQRMKRYPTSRSSRLTGVQYTCIPIRLALGE